MATGNRAGRTALGAIACALMFALLAITPATFGARAEPDTLIGVALVIGQSEYEHLAPLTNPENDAEAVDRLLSDLGFEIDGVSNADARKLRRALERFAEDAAEADVALIYYSGHGIEAGGENFLVPVDADVSALDDAAERLVPLSALLADLQEAVPVTIVLLDACRDNPFPPDALVRVDGAAQPAPVSTAGLSAPRGARPLAAVADAAPAGENFGSVVGFAAAPGRVALDGAPGGNSPYAAALLKHLSAGGYPFGDVMTMVSEEVWLKTRAAQTPWTNTSLRRQLWFGETAPEPQGEEGAIRGERRGLLLRIAGLGEAERRQVASRAQETGVPMDALFAMLSAVGADMPEDPAELDRLLHEQATRLKGILADRAALIGADAEIRRLASLADAAISEGALKAAIGFNERAKARVAELSRNLDDVEEQLRRRRGEFAAIYAKSAETYALAYDFAAAARDYAAAYEQVARADPNIAWRFKASEAEALGQHGFYRADRAALARSIALYEDTLGLVSRETRPAEWAELQSGLGRALWTQAGQSGDRADLVASIDALRAALSVQSRDRGPQQWASTQGTLGAVLMSLGLQEEGDARFLESKEALEAGLEVFSREKHPLEWARFQNRLGVTYLSMAMRDPGTQYLERALAYFEAALQERSSERAPYDFAQVQNNIALVHSYLADRVPAGDHLARSIEAYTQALSVYDRELTPMLWAEGKSNLGTLYWQMAGRESGLANATLAETSFREALEVTQRARAPWHWAALQDNLASALKLIGLRSDDIGRIEEARTRFELALQERRRDTAPMDWATTTMNLANTLVALGGKTFDPALMDRAAVLYREAAEVNHRGQNPLEWARIMANVGLTLYTRSLLQFSEPHLEQAAGAIRQSLEENRRDRVPFDWALGRLNLARVLLELGKHRRDRAMLAEALSAVSDARAVHGEAGRTDYDESFDCLEAGIRLADLDIEVADKLKQAQSEGR